MFESAEPLIAEHNRLEAQLADPATHADPVLMRRVGRRYATLHPVVEALALHQRLAADREVALELAEQDPVFAEEAEAIGTRLEEVAARLTRMLAPRDPNDDADAILEIRSGEGGEESALFASDLLRMYQRFAEQIGWHVEILDSQATDLGGVKSVTLAVKGTSVDGIGPYGRLKFEGGVHRVQRVPVTETQGRIHTSAAGVLVSPDIEAEELAINESDLRIDVFRASGPGGQGVNTTDSAVRITHLPTGVVVSCQNERSQLQNREQAMRLLRSRLAAIREAEAAEAASASRRSQVRTVDRSERIRTYNFPENRFADHRIGFKAHNLDLILEGALTPVLDALAEADLAERLSRSVR